MTLGETVYQARLAVGLSRADLAALTGMTADAVKFVEQGGNPPPERRVALAQALGLEPSALVELASGPAPKGKQGRPKKLQPDERRRHALAVALALTSANEAYEARELSAAHRSRLERYALVRDRGLTVEQLAQVFCVSTTTIYRWEREVRVHLLTEGEGQ